MGTKKGAFLFLLATTTRMFQHSALVAQGELALFL